MQSETKLSFKEKIGYAVGDTASNLIFQVYILFLLFFYTDVFGITAKAAATMFLVARIWDAINDPIMGALSDRTNTRWGKFRPFILFGAIPFGVIGVLTFTTPGFSDTGKLIWAYTTYISLTMIYTLVNVPYSALMGVISPNSEQRTVVSSFRFVAAFVGQFIVQYAILRLVSIFGDGNEQLGWQWAMTVLCALAVILYFVTFASTKERVVPPKEQKTPFKQDLKDLFNNGPWLMIASATIFQLIYNCMRNGNVIYYFKYFVQDQDVSLFGKMYSFSFESLASAFMLSGTAVTICGALLSTKFSKIFDKSKNYAGFLIITGIGTAIYYFFKPSNIVIMFAINLVISFSIGIVSVLQWAIYTDTADYSEWKNKRRATGLLMSASLFALKLGIALGGALLAWLLSEYGFEPNVQQAEKALSGIRMAMSIWPAIFALIGGLIMWLYPLTNKKMLEIEKDLIARRK